MPQGEVIVRAPRWTQVRTALAAPRDIAALAVFRMALGLIAFVSALRFLAYGWIDELFIRPTVRFSYWGFDWIPVPSPGATRAPWQLQWQTNPAGMAHRLTELYQRAVKVRRRDGLGRVYWYTWGTKYSGDDLFDYGGLVHWTGSAFQSQPALKAYVKSARGAEGCRKTSAGLCIR